MRKHGLNLFPPALLAGSLLALASGAPAAADPPGADAPHTARAAALIE